MNNQYAVIRSDNGKYTICVDWSRSKELRCASGNMAWGSPTYQVLNYFPTYKAASEFVQQQGDKS